MKLQYDELKKIIGNYPVDVGGGGDCGDDDVGCTELPVFDTFVEGGTYMAETISAMEPHFKELHTIEIAWHYYNLAKNKYKNSKIQFHLGDTTKLLPTILQTLKGKPTVFFMDSHWSCSNTGKGDIEVPLLEELKIINKEYNENCVLIIDDYRLFNGNDKFVDWSEITEPNILACIDQEKILKIHIENDRYILYLRKV